MVCAWAGRLSARQQTKRRSTRAIWRLFCITDRSCGKSLDTRRFQSAVSEKDLLIGIRRLRTGGDVYPGLVPINSSFSESARWKRRVPRAGPNQFVFLRDRALEATRTRERFSLFRGVATRQ